jgi:hypothetical protein
LTAEEKEAIRAARDTAGIGKKRKIATVGTEEGGAQGSTPAAATGATPAQAGVGDRMTRRSA